MNYRDKLVSIHGKQPKLKGKRCRLSKHGLHPIAEGKGLEDAKKLIGVVSAEPKYIHRITILWDSYKRPKVYFRNEIEFVDNSLPRMSKQLQKAFNEY